MSNEVDDFTACSGGDIYDFEFESSQSLDQSVSMSPLPIDSPVLNSSTNFSQTETVTTNSFNWNDLSTTFSQSSTVTETSEVFSVVPSGPIDLLASLPEMSVTTVSSVDSLEYSQNTGAGNFNFNQLTSSDSTTMTFSGGEVSSTIDVQSITQEVLLGDGLTMVSESLTQTLSQVSNLTPMEMSVNQNTVSTEWTSTIGGNEVNFFETRTQTNEQFTSLNDPGMSWSREQITESSSLNMSGTLPPMNLTLPVEPSVNLNFSNSMEVNFDLSMNNQVDFGFGVESQFASTDLTRQFGLNEQRSVDLGISFSS